MSDLRAVLEQGSTVTSVADTKTAISSVNAGKPLVHQSSCSLMRLSSPLILGTKTG